LLVAAFALMAQWFAISTQDMRPRDHGAAQARQVVADLKAAFGDSFVLCIQDSDDGSAPSPRDPNGHCDDHCPLCQLHSAAMALWAPAPMAVAIRAEASAKRVLDPPGLAPSAPRRDALAQPRAPPLEA
jgi:hypothetical protein